MDMMDEADVQYVESDIIRWVGFLWDSYTDAGILEEPPARLVEAKTRIDAAVKTAGIPETYRPLSEGRSTQLCKAGIMIPRRAVRVGDNIYRVTEDDSCGVRQEEAHKPKRPSETDIAEIRYLDDQRKKRMLTLIRTKK